MVHTLYASAAGSVSLDFRDSGSITCIIIETNNAATGAAEVSFNSSSQLTTNDTTGVLAGVIIAVGSARGNLFPMNEPIDAGERVYLHTTGANIVRATIITSGTTTRASTRRR